MWIVVLVLREDSAVGMENANATAASALTVTMGLCVTSAQAARHHVRDTGKASGFRWWEQGTVGLAEHPPACSNSWRGVGEGQWVTAGNLLQYLLDRDCAECGAFGTGPLATNCTKACAQANVTLTSAPISDDGWCKDRTLDNQLFFLTVEDEDGGKVVLRVRPQESKWVQKPGTY
jgi:hypothetical protein